MKKSRIVVLCVMAVVAVVWFTTLSGVMKFELVGGYNVDMTEFRRASIMTGMPSFTYFYPVGKFQENKGFAGVRFSGFGIDYSKYANRDMIITAGRELVEVKYRYIDPWKTQAVGEVTFAEEYHDGVMFIYATDRIPLPPSWGWNKPFRHNKYYVMQGDERVYIGDKLSEFNKMGM